MVTNNLTQTIEQAINIKSKKESAKAYKKGVRIGSMYTFFLTFPLFGLLHAFSYFEFFGGMLVATIVFSLVTIVFYFLKE